MQKERIASFARLAENLNESEEQRLLLAMLLDSYYTNMLREKTALPEEKPVHTSGKNKKKNRNRPRRKNKKTEN